MMTTTVVKTFRDTLAEARHILDQAKSESRDLTEAEAKHFDAKMVEAEELRSQQIKAATVQDAEQRFQQLAEAGRKSQDDVPQQYKSLGDHFIGTVGSAENLARVKQTSGHTISAPDYRKAATDDHGTPAGIVPALTDWDLTIRGEARRATIADIFQQGTLSGTAISYLLESPMEGDVAPVSPGGKKPQLHMTDPVVVTDIIRKIAGFHTVQDEMIEDAPFLVSEINGICLYKLALREEQQLVSGTGTAPEILGILNRTGILSQTQGSDVMADTVYKAMTNVMTLSGRIPDALVINPQDYQTLRLSRDTNGQYLGGGPFTGNFGIGPVQYQPGPWGLNCVISPAVPPKTAVVGAFKQASTLYRKGGVRVEMTNSHDQNFTSNKTTIRLEERLALAVRIPSGISKITFA